MTDHVDPESGKHAGAASDPARAMRPDPAALAGLLSALRERQPLVQCITNSVTTNFVANALLAIGAAPAMVDLPEEAPICARAASALLVNLGTPNTESMAAMRDAVIAAHAAGTPWVLDPVAVGFLPVRTRLAAELLQSAPTIVRGNASEIIALAGTGHGGRGVDSTDSADNALDAALQISAHTHGAVAISGPVDILTDGVVTWRLANGDARLTRVTGGGCALGAVMAAFASLGASPLAAAGAATAAYTIAAELAAGKADGPGSFAVAFIDQLCAITPTVIEQRLALA